MDSMVPELYSASHYLDISIHPAKDPVAVRMPVINANDDPYRVLHLLVS